MCGRASNSRGDRRYDGRVLAYLATKSDFIDDAPVIEDLVQRDVRQHLGLRVGSESPEYSSWHNSLGNAMFHVVNTSQIPDDAGIAIEYRINGRSLRIDFLIAGVDGEGRENLVIVELKQWTLVQPSELGDCVRTAVGRGMRDVPHPSFQSYSYARQLLDFYEVIDLESIGVHSCAYIHNCDNSSVLVDAGPSYYVSRAPVFLRGQHRELRQHIAARVVTGPGVDLLRRVDESRIRPAKQLVEALGSMLDGNEEFVLVDEQKLVLERIIDVEKKTPAGEKAVVIVRGGPGTGKSLIAVNGLVRFSGMQRSVRYVSKNAAPRRVYEVKLKGRMRNAEIRELFVSSDAFRDVAEESYDVLLIDEAHRLTEKGGLYGNLGDHQVAELINCARVSVFFVDEDQKVTWRDVGDVAEIERWAEQFGASVHYMDLVAQFRCAGSDVYLEWLDDVLGISGDEPPTLSLSDFDVRVIDSPSELRELIFERNRERNRARLVAGYCWDWVSKSNSQKKDIVFDGTDFAMRWNLSSDGSTWMIAPNSVHEVGCIHTSQGLECDYIGVIIGPDLLARDGHLVSDPFARARTDQSLKGFKKAFKSEPEAAYAHADRLIRNTYMTLMSRGMRGCYIYCTDQETQDYFRAHLGGHASKARSGKG